MSRINVGDIVVWRGCFGMDAPRAARVTGIEITAEPRSKYGTPVKSVSHLTVQDNRALFTLDTGNWCYSEQIVLPQENQLWNS